MPPTGVDVEEPHVAQHQAAAMVSCRAEQSRAEQSRAEQSRSRAEQSRAEQSRAEQSRAERDNADWWDAGGGIGIRGLWIDR